MLDICKFRRLTKWTGEKRDPFGKSRSALRVLVIPPSLYSPSMETTLDAMPIGFQKFNMTKNSLLYRYYRKHKVKTYGSQRIILLQLLESAVIVVYSLIKSQHIHHRN